MRASIPSVTIGIDLASRAKRTSICRIDWTGGNIEAAFLDQTDDPGITELIRSATDDVIIGIDCPLGWPTDFVNFVSAHAERDAPPAAPAYPPERRLDIYQYRLTDECVWQSGTGRPPLSVSTNLLGVVALRCARILDPLGQTIDRSGVEGPVVEVYPAASLRYWGQVAKGDDSYKKNSAQREQIIDRIAASIPVDDVTRSACVKSHDNLDAFVAALSARSAGLGKSTAPTDKQLDTARVEGWIHVPACGLAELL